MPDPVLTLLKYVFLAVLYLFFLRVIRAVWVEVREPKATPPRSEEQSEGTGGAFGAPTAPADHPAPGRRRGPEKLVVVEPAERKGTEFPLADEMTLGRAPGCGVSLPEDSFVSQLHARIFRRDGDLHLEDLGSTNGTYLNGKRITVAAPIRKGDRVQVGRTTLELRK